MIQWSGISSVLFVHTVDGPALLMSPRAARLAPPLSPPMTFPTIGLTAPPVCTVSLTTVVVELTPNVLPTILVLVCIGTFSSVRTLIAGRPLAAT